MRAEHAGDRSPLALANREIGALPPQARKEAGMRIGQARGAVNQALAARQEVLEAEHEERMLAEETVDVTLPWDRTPVGARHPLTTLSERIGDVFIAMGWEIAEGPVVEAEWLNFDALNAISFGRMQKTIPAKCRPSNADGASRRPSAEAHS